MATIFDPILGDIEITQIAITIRNADTNEALELIVNRPGVIDTADAATVWVRDWLTAGWKVHAVVPEPKA